MPEAYLLVLGSSTDRQLVSVVDELRRIGTSVVFLDCDAPVDFRISCGSDGAASLSLSGQPLSAPSLVWARLKISPILGHWSTESIPEYVRRSEWLGLQSWLSALYADRALYPLTAVTHSDSKLLQFRAAAEVGFAVLPASVTVGGAEALKAMSSMPLAVAKPIRTRLIPALAGAVDDYRLLGPMDVDIDSIVEAAAAGELEDTPLFVQRKLTSGREIRVIAFRDRCFTYQLHSRLEERLFVDERRLYEVTGNEENYSLRYEQVDPPANLQRLVGKFLAQFGLFSGTFDVVEESGTVYFLEFNPEGQWYAASRYNAQEVVAHCATEISRLVHGAG